MRPLDGVRVLDLTRLLPGGVCTMMLADLGAQIIKVEDPFGGDYARWMPPLVAGQSVFFRMNNRQKSSIILNLKESQGQDVLRTLVKSADVLIESFRPGVMDRLGCGYDSLKVVNPRLVYCGLSGWGVDGPYSQNADHDLNYVSVAGMPGSMETPQVIGGQVADIGGAYIAVTGILAALLRRERTGEGTFVDTSLAEAALPFMLYNWVENHALGTSAGQGGLTGGLACYRIYAAQDGNVALAALEPKFWSNFCNAVNRPDLISDHQNPERQRYLIGELKELFATQTVAAWEAQLGAADCCFSRVNALSDITNDPQFKARGMLGIFPDGTPWMRSPVRMNDEDVVIVNTVSDYGEDTRTVLEEAGYDAAQIAALVEAGIVKVYTS